MKVCDSKKGFTLVEIIIAVAILVMVMIPIGNAIIQSSKDNANSTKTIIATQLVQKNMEDIKARVSTKVDGSGNKKAGEDLTLNAPGATAGTTPWHDGDTKYTPDATYTAAAGTNPATWSDDYEQDSYKYTVKYTIIKKFGEKELQKTNDYGDGSLAAFGSNNSPLTINGAQPVILKKDGTNFKIDGVSGNAPLDATEVVLYIKAANASGDKAVFVNQDAADGITVHCNVIDSQALTLDGETGINSKGGKAINIDRNDIDSGYYNDKAGDQQSVAVYNIRIEVYDKNNPTKLLASANSKSMIKN